MNRTQRYIIREIIPMFLMGNFFFMFLLLLEKLVTLADLFFSKNVPMYLIVETVLYFLPSLFVMTIPLACLLAVLIAFSRLSADSELIAMRSIGASNASLIKPVVVFGTAAAFICLLMSCYFVEKGSRLALNNLNKVVENISISDLKENEMYDGLPGILLFVRHKMDDSNFEGVIAVNQFDGTIVTAASGAINPTDNKSLEMLFSNGRVTLKADDGETTSIAFDKLMLNMPLDIDIAKAVSSPMIMSVKELYQRASEDKKAAFELSKRIALPVSAVIMALFGFSLGVFLSRSGKSFGVLLSIGVAFLYNFLMVYIENMSGKLPVNPYLAAWIPNILFAGLLAIFLKRSFR